MLTTAAIEFFKSKSAIAEALGISTQAVSQWSDVVPLVSAYKLQEISGGKVRVDHHVYRAGRWVPKKTEFTV